VQRRSDLIISGGENVYPAEVENVLREHPAIRNVAVVGLEDMEWGQRVAAAIQINPGHNITEAEIIAYSRKHLAGYKQPRTIRFVDMLPQTASGKIQRQAVKALFKDS
ncbi:MAG: o-succinylbenzoate--CoA ligase, partial [Anaerolineae bacterium]|nr:o-succinylbenzoate--CoA ligase [Anaerolineae bacterium]